MSSKSKKPDATPVSEGEKQQAALSREQYNHYKTTYSPIEHQFAEEVSRDYSARLGGQVGTAASREMTPGLQSMALSGAPVDTADLASTVTAGRQGAWAQGRRASEDGMLTAAKIGLGVSGDAGNSIGDAGRVQTNVALTDLQAKLQEQKAKSEERAALYGAVGQVAGVGLGYAGSKYLAGGQGAVGKQLSGKKTVTTMNGTGRNYGGYA